jgi:hypothetical protein
MSSGNQTQQEARNDSGQSLIAFRLLVGLHELDELPTIAGCVDEATYEVEPQEDTDRRWKACKKEFGGVADEYEWREVRVEVPAADILRYFDRPVVKGSVKA